ncbi:MAG: hypothetical protein IH598_12270 [Bacteroidales bacterium]|nr:hypothetical protein [Bacteroidales bacterium]
MTTIRIDTKTKPARELVNFLRSLSFVQVLEAKEVDSELNEETIEAIREFESGESVVCENYDDYLKKIEDV